MVLESKKKKIKNELCSFTLILVYLNKYIYSYKCCLRHPHRCIYSMKNRLSQYIHKLFGVCLRFPLKNSLYLCDNSNTDPTTRRTNSTKHQKCKCNPLIMSPLLYLKTIPPEKNNDIIHLNSLQYRYSIADALIYF